MKYAKIIDGLVMQIQPNEEVGFIEVDDNVVCGMVQDGDSFITPERVRTQEEANQDIFKKLDELQLKYNKNEFRYKRDSHYQEYKEQYELYRDELLMQIK